MDVDDLAAGDEGVDLAVVDQDDLDVLGLQPGRLDQRPRDVAQQRLGLGVAQDRLGRGRLRRDREAQARAASAARDEQASPAGAASGELQPSRLLYPFARLNPDESAGRGKRAHASGSGAEGPLPPAAARRAVLVRPRRLRRSRLRPARPSRRPSWLRRRFGAGRCHWRPRAAARLFRGAGSAPARPASRLRPRPSCGGRASAWPARSSAAGSRLGRGRRLGRGASAASARRPRRACGRAGRRRPLRARLGASASGGRRARPSGSSAGGRVAGFGRRPRPRRPRPRRARGGGRRGGRGGGGACGRRRAPRAPRGRSRSPRLAAARLAASASSSSSSASSSSSSSSTILVARPPRRLGLGDGSRRGRSAGGGPCDSTLIRAPSKLSSISTSIDDAVARLDLADLGALLVEQVDRRLAAGAQHDPRCRGRAPASSSSIRSADRPADEAVRISPVPSQCGQGRVEASSTPVRSRWRLISISPKRARCGRPGCGRGRSSAPPSSPSRPCGYGRSIPCR